MRVGTFLLLDETISGTAMTWYSPANTFEPLGRGDIMSFSAAISNATGGPTLTVQAEHSADGQNWTTVNAAAEINSTIASNTVLIGNPNATGAMFLHFVRLRARLTAGASPQCRLKLGATTRSV